MLKPAKLYEDELQKLYCEKWHDYNLQFYTGWRSGGEFNISEDAYNRNEFVSVDAEGNIYGYIGYAFDFYTGVADNFGILSFKKSNALFAKDLLQVVDDIFIKYKFRLMSWRMVGDNPVEKHYQKFCKKYGGQEVARLKDYCRFNDGSYHDDVIFLLTRENYLKNR